MSSIKEHDYLKVCAKLASCFSISIAAAKKKVDIAAASQGARDVSERKKIAEMLLEEAQKQSSSEKNKITTQLDDLLKALAEEENFMVED